MVTNGPTLMDGGHSRSDQLEKLIEANENAPSLARRWLREQLHGHSRSDDAILATSEVVTNVVSHGPRGPMTLRLSNTDGSIRVEVTQPRIWSIRAPVGFSAADDLHGRGLAIVGELSDRWGVLYQDDSTVVWFEMA